MSSRQPDREGPRGRRSSLETGSNMPRPMLERLAQYYQIATRAGESGTEYMVSADLARLLGIDDTLVRKDMAGAGIIGRPKLGYAVGEILATLDARMGLTQRNEALLFGAGHLANALINYPGFARYGLRIAAVFDTDPRKVGQSIGGLTILPMEKCRSILDMLRIRIAILTVPADAAQQLADWLVPRGVRAIWNFAPVKLQVSEEVVVREENLALGLAQLMHQLMRRQGTPLPAPLPLDPDPDLTPSSRELPPRHTASSLGTPLEPLPPGGWTGDR